MGRLVGARGARRQEVYSSLERRCAGARRRDMAVAVQEHGDREGPAARARSPVVWHSSHRLRISALGACAVASKRVLFTPGRAGAYDALLPAVKDDTESMICQQSQESLAAGWDTGVGQRADSPTARRIMAGDMQGEWLALSPEQRIERADAAVRALAAKSYMGSAVAEMATAAATPPRVREIGSNPAVARKLRKVSFEGGSALGDIEAAEAVDDEPPLENTVDSPPHGIHIPSTARLLLPFSALPRASGEVRDADGKRVEWPWEPKGGLKPRTVLPVDKSVRAALASATARRNKGSLSSGVRAWIDFCAKLETTPHRPLDPNEPLWAKLEEEWLAMRFVCSLVEVRGVKPRTAASYLGEVQSWHLREHGVKVAAGIKLERVRQMLKGLRREHGDGERKVRRGIKARTLRMAMDMCLDPSVPHQANLRAALSVAFQGLLRGAEFTVDGRLFNPDLDMSRADIASLTWERAVMMMRPCKNMNHLRGKTVPLVIGAGGTMIDAVAELHNMMQVDPTPEGAEGSTPMFRDATGGALKSNDVRDLIKYLMRIMGEEPTQYGLHSLRIGGATALFAGGADPLVIRTMGRWSSDCYRLYVRACFGQTLEWTARAGSTEVDDIAGEFAEVDCY